VAVKGLKNNKSAGPDGIPAEVFKHGDHHLIHRLHQFIHRAWTTGKLPQQRKDATTVTIYKKEGIFPPMLEFHISTVWRAVSLTCID